MVRSRLVKTLAYLVALPPLLATTLLAGVAATERTGGHVPFLRSPQTLVEAAASEDRAAAAVFLESGGTPDAIGMLTEAPDARPILVSAFEAAVLSGDLPMLQLLEARANGTVIERANLACLARDVEAAQIWRYLSADSAPSCESGVTLKLVLSRR